MRFQQEYLVQARVVIVVVGRPRTVAARACVWLGPRSAVAAAVAVAVAVAVVAVAVVAVVTVTPCSARSAGELARNA